MSGSGYRDCDTVFLFLDSQRIGTTRPDDEGNIRVAGLSVPGGTKQGTHAVTSSCNANGTQVRATASVQVTGGTHRSAFVTALPKPGQVSTDPKDLAVSAALTLGLLALIAFPSEVFNGTFEENFGEIRAWFRRPRRALASARRANQNAVYAVFLALGGLLYAALSPDFGLNLSSLALVAGMVFGLAVVSLGFGVPANLYTFRRHRELGRLAVLPASILVAAACVGFSRLLHFQPGYLFGLIAGFTFRHEQDERTEGRLTAAGSLFILVVGVAAWLAMGPVSAAAARPSAGPLLFALEAALGATFLLGLESLLVGLLPLRFLNGSKVFGWSRTAWAALFGLSLFGTLHVLLAPGSGYVGSTSGRVTIGVVALYVGFGLASFAFWAYFRFRPESWIPVSARGPEGDFEDIERI